MLYGGRSAEVEVEAASGQISYIMAGGTASEEYISPKPFVGGAEKARRNARKRMYQPRRKSSDSSNSASNNKRRRNETITSPYPKSMREYERYFGSLLSSSTIAIQKSETDGRSHSQVMQQACSLLNVPSLPPPAYLQQKLATSRKSDDDDARTHHLIQRSSSILSNASSYSTASATTTSSGTYDNARSYYMSKTPLILEESRCIIADALAKLSYTNNNNNKKQRHGGNHFLLELTSVEEKYPKLMQSKQAPLILNFQIITNDLKSNISSKKQQHYSNEGSSAKWTRPGCVLLLEQHPTQCKSESDSQSSPSVLACIVPNGNHQSASSNTLSLMIFRRHDLDLVQFQDNDMCNNNNGSKDDVSIFYATSLTTLIGQVRQMECCLRMVKVSFMNKLLGQKNATHIRFGNSSSDEEDEDEEVVGFVDDNIQRNSQQGYYVDEGDESADCSVDGDDISNCEGSLSNLLTRIPTLNETQELAAKKFLSSPSESLILVQG